MPMDEFFGNVPRDTEIKRKSLPLKAKSQGLLEEKVYDRYYFNSSTITTAQATDPNDFDNANYNVEPIYQKMGRKADKLWIANDAASGSGINLYVVASHIDETTFSREMPLYPQQFMRLNNIFEVRLRSPTKGTPYRVSEYEFGTL